MTTTRTRIGALGALFAAVVVPLILASPAQAASKDGCSVVPERPYFNNHFTSNGKKIVAYPIHVHCKSSLKVEIQQHFLERDIANGTAVYSNQGAPPNWTLGPAWWPFELDETVPATAVLPYHDSNGDDEVLHEVRFFVRNGSVAGTWSNWEKSEVRAITF